MNTHIACTFAETPQSEALVLHAVLGADHRQARRGARRELDEERLAVLGLCGQHGDVAASESGRRRARGRRDRQLDAAVGIAQLESLGWRSPPGGRPGRRGRRRGRSRTGARRWHSRSRRRRGSHNACAEPFRSVAVLTAPVSRITVTGPWLASSTSMSAPKRPVATRPRGRGAARRRGPRAARRPRPGAAATKEGRRPLEASP